MAPAQGTRADYERAAKLPEMARGKVTNLDPQLAWNDDGSAAIFRRDKSPTEREWLRVEAATSEMAPAFDHAKLAKLLKADSDKLPIDRVTPGGKPEELFFPSRRQRLPLRPRGRRLDRGQAAEAEARRATPLRPAPHGRIP